MMSHEELELIKAEYGRLAQEINSTLSHRLQIVQFGLAIVGTLVGFAVIGTNPWSPFVAAVMIPTACAMVVFLWLSEVRRTRRASWYVYGLERRVNSQLGHRVLRWEEDIRGKQFHPSAIFRFHYYTTAYFFVLVGISASIYGVRNWVDIPAQLGFSWLLIYGVGLVLTVTVILRRLRRFDFPDPHWPNMMPDKPAKVNNESKQPISSVLRK